jgi:hypothetical protein
MTLVHERDSHGESTYRFTGSGTGSATPVTRMPDNSSKDKPSHSKGTATPRGTSTPRTMSHMNLRADKGEGKGKDDAGHSSKEKGSQDSPPETPDSKRKPATTPGPEASGSDQ